ncbi:MAG: NTP transferase domain-containing protein [Candidatus Kuenenia sp.]|nr:NTP transferase domain-containing protein [Candidatus Kuenenia hertensis]
MVNLHDIDVIILCGGYGTRLREVINNVPKPMAEINGKPFMDILLNYISSFGFTRYILCIGYKGDVIRDYYENKNNILKFLFSEETEAMGTAGAIKKTETLIQSDFFLTINGDSLCKINIQEFFKFHLFKNAFASIALITKDKSVDCGIIKLNNSGRITGFHEKIITNETSFVNAGMYIFNRKIFSFIPENKKYSLETDLFPNLVNHKDIYGFKTQEQLFDIGTPERYQIAKKYLR